MLFCLVLGGLAVAAGLFLWRSRRGDALRTPVWDTLARDFMLGFDPGTRSIRGKYRLLRLEITARRTVLGLGSWRTHVSARYEGVVPEGLTLGLDRRGDLRASARTPQTLGRWLDAHRRRELLQPLLRGGVHVSGHIATLLLPGLLTDPEALRTLLGQLAELAKLLSLR
ncbi:MAG TPA: hypothetical protein VLQ79_02230 [Myxococcaceae bacterium]|nr:hypothetical protein [Myxococcaceae bacterium]